MFLKNIQTLLIALLRSRKTTKIDREVQPNLINANHHWDIYNNSYIYIFRKLFEVRINLKNNFFSQKHYFEGIPFDVTKTFKRFLK